MHKSAFLLGSVSAMAILAGANAVHATPVTATWQGGSSGDWGTASNWSTNTVPNNGSNFYTVRIDNGAAPNADVTLQQIAAIDRLEVTAGDMLRLRTSSARLNIQRSGRTGSGVIDNAGTILLDRQVSSPTLTVTSAVTVTGAGTLTMEQATITDDSVGLSGSDSLTIDSMATINGSGSLDTASMAVTNNGTISANVSGQILSLSAGNASNTKFTNNGIIEARGGGTLDVIAGPLVNNNKIQTAGASTISVQSGASITGGTIDIKDDGLLLLATGDATVSGSTINVDGEVQVDRGVFSGVTMNIRSGGVFDINNTFVSTTFQGDLNIASGGQMTLTATDRYRFLNGSVITNDGTISLDRNVNSPTIDFTGTTTLQGSGTLRLEQATLRDDQIFGSDHLIIEDAATVEGSGSFTTANMAVTNDGLISANVSGQTLSLSAGNASNTKFTNNGTVKARGGGTLDVIAGPLVNNNKIQTVGASTISVQNTASITGGTIDINDDGLLHLETGNATIANATVDVDGTVKVTSGIFSGATVNIASGGVFDINSASVSNTFQGNLNIASGGLMTLTATDRYRFLNGSVIDNDGTISLDRNVNSPTIDFQGTTTLQGSGSLTLQQATLRDDQTIGSDHLIIEDAATVEGSGSFTTANMAVTNHGLISANVSGQTLSLSAGNASNTKFTNNGLIEARGGGTLDVIAGPLVNNNKIQTIGASTISVQNTASISGGTIDINDDGLLLLATGDATVSGSTINVDGEVQVDRGVFSGVTMNIRSGGVFDINSAFVSNTFQGDLNIASGGQMTLTATDRYRFLNGSVITNDGTISLDRNVNSPTIDFSGTTTLQGSGTLRLEQATLRDDQTIGSDHLIIGNNARVVGSGSFTTASMAVTNNGLIRANVSGQTLSLSAGNASNTKFNNNGIIEARGGGTLDVIAGPLVNNNIVQTVGASTISVQHTASITGGTIDINDNGLLLLATGDATVSGSTIIVDGEVQVDRGVFSGVTMNIRSGGVFDINSAFVSNTFQGDLNIASGGQMTLTATDRYRFLNGSVITNDGTISLDRNVNSPTIDFQGATTLTGAGTLTLEKATLRDDRAVGTDTLTIDTQATIEGSGSIGENGLSLVQNGIIRANISGQTLTIDNMFAGFTNGGVLISENGAAFDLNDTSLINNCAVAIYTGSTMTATAPTATYTQNAGLTLVDGTFTVNQATFTAGFLSGAGSLAGDVDTIDAVIAPGSVNGAGGQLEITETLGMTGDSGLLIDIDHDGSFSVDSLLVGDAATIDGALYLNLSDTAAAALAQNDRFRILTADSVTGSFDTPIQVSHTGLIFEAIYGAGWVDIRVTGDSGAHTGGGQPAVLAQQLSDLIDQKLINPPQPPDPPNPPEAPVPGALGLLLAGLAARFGLARRG